MKAQVLFLLLTGCLLTLAAWLLHAPDPVQADEIPQKYRKTVARGLEYLVKNQGKDGHWEGDGGQHPVAMTGLVGLALFMDGSADITGKKVDENGKNFANMRKAVDWLMDKSQAGRDGLIFSGHPSETGRYMHGHGLATLFLAGFHYYQDDPDDGARRKQILTRAVSYIVKAQSTQGGWYRTSKVEGHDHDEFLATVIQVQALQAAENAGIPVPSETINDGKEYVTKALERYEKGAKPGPNRGRQTDTAAALACVFNDENERRSDLSDKWFKYCQVEIPVGGAMQFGRDDLSHYYFAQTVFNRGGDTWSKYRTAMFEHLQTSQNKDGSWPASEGIGVGRVYATALWCTMLQLDKRVHPSRRRIPVISN